MRRAASLIIASIAVVVMGIVFYLTLGAWSSLGSPSGISNYRIGLSNAIQVTPVSVEGAGWQIVIMVENLGNVDALVDTIYVNKVPVAEKGLIHGGSLSSRLSIGTSIPLDGLVIPVGKSANIYLWIGNDKFSRGTSIEIEIQKVDSLELRKTITLK